MGVVVDGLVAPTSTATVTIANFSAWMLEEQRRIFLLCHRMLDDREDADSATQDVFLKAYLALSKEGRTITGSGKWLTRIAVNVCLDRLRSRRWQLWRRRPKAEDEASILLLVPARGPSAEERAFALEIGERLRLALKKLSGRQRAVFLLRHYDERSLDEIAGVLDMEVGTVKAHLSRALSKLRGELKDLYSMRRGPEGERA